jgi:NAD(P)-dependent dehydrogenase (short-subunit alcohol dehydrogenase family)
MATIFSPLHGIEPDEYRRSTEVIYLGTVWGTMAALRRMRGRNRGTIVLVGSALAYRGIPLQAPYCGAKHAIKGFFESLRSELLHERRGIHVTMVQLPAHNTPQFSWGRTRM